MCWGASTNAQAIIPERSDIKRGLGGGSTGGRADCCASRASSTVAVRCAARALIVIWQKYRVQMAGGRPSRWVSAEYLGPRMSDIEVGPELACGWCRIVTNSDQSPQ